MRTLTSLFSVVAVTLALGCGGGDGPVADATPPAPDAPPPAPDEKG